MTAQNDHEDKNVSSVERFVLWTKREPFRAFLLGVAVLWVVLILLNVAVAVAPVSRPVRGQMIVYTIGALLGLGVVLIVVNGVWLGINGLRNLFYPRKFGEYWKMTRRPLGLVMLGGAIACSGALLMLLFGALGVKF